MPRVVQIDDCIRCALEELPDMTEPYRPGGTIVLDALVG
jgi:hypothetical protein